MTINLTQTMSSNSEIEGLQNYLEDANDKADVPDCCFKQIPALNHLIHQGPTANTTRGCKLIIVAERYGEDHHADILKHFDPLAALIHALGAYSNQLVSESVYISRLNN